MDNDIDAGANYYNVLFNNPIKYYDSTSLNNISQVANSGTPHFLMHLNSRSLVKNIDHLIIELSLLSNEPSINAVSETWALSNTLPITQINCSS